MTDAQQIAKLRRDVDILTGLVVGLVSLAETRTRVAVRNYDATTVHGPTAMKTIALTELAAQQAQVLRLANDAHAGFEGDTLVGYEALLGRLNDAIGDYAMPVMTAQAMAA